MTITTEMLAAGDELNAMGFEHTGTIEGDPAVSLECGRVYTTPGRGLTVYVNALTAPRILACMPKMKAVFNF